MARQTVQSFLFRAGAFGTLHGAHPGRPAVGLTVAVTSDRAFGEVLETLRELKVRATLLVSAETAQSGAAELWRATRAGHEVAGLDGPADPLRLEALTGQPVRFWAWSAGPVPWKSLRAVQAAGIAPLPAPTQTPAPGAIVRLEAAGLREGVQELKRLGYQPGPVGALRDLRRAAPRDLLHDLYQRAVEDRYAEREGVIDLSQRFDAVLRVAPLDHAPPPLPLAPSTPTAELHVNSARLVGLASGNLTATYKAYGRSLRDVAHALETRPELAQAQAVFAVTLFHSPLEKAGFTILDLPPLRARWYGLGFRLLRLAYGTTRTPSEGTPKMGWMTRPAFLERYGRLGKG